MFGPNLASLLFASVCVRPLDTSAFRRSVVASDDRVCHACVAVSTPFLFSPISRLDGSVVVASANTLKPYRKEAASPPDDGIFKLVLPRPPEQDGIASLHNQEQSANRSIWISRRIPDNNPKPTSPLLGGNVAFEMLGSLTLSGLFLRSFAVFHTLATCLRTCKLNKTFRRIISSLL